MGTDDRVGDDLHAVGVSIGQRFKGLNPDPRNGPPLEAFMDGCAESIALRQIAPRRAGSQNPGDAAEYPAHPPDTRGLSGRREWIRGQAFHPVTRRHSNARLAPQLLRLVIGIRLLRVDWRHSDPTPPGNILQGAIGFASSQIHWGSGGGTPGAPAGWPAARRRCRTGSDRGAAFRWRCAIRLQRGPWPGGGCQGRRGRGSNGQVQGASAKSSSGSPSPRQGKSATRAARSCAEGRELAPCAASALPRGPDKAADALQNFRE